MHKCCSSSIKYSIYVIIGTLLPLIIAHVWRGSDSLVWFRFLREININTFDTYGFALLSSSGVMLILTLVLFNKYCNKKTLSLSSNIIAPWTVDYKKIDSSHSCYDLCNNLMIGIKTTTYIHFVHKLKQQSLWRKMFCYICNRKHNDIDNNSYRYDDDHINLDKLQFTEFYPTKFADIRSWNGLSSEIYIKTFDESLLAFITNSKSGMYFFYTSNGKFLIKSLKNSEYCFFRKIFNDYYEYLKKNKNTLINRFYGMYGVKEHRFMVMESIFYSDLDIETIYDLKGSSKGRISKKTEKVLKDLNWQNSERKINIGHKSANLYRNQLKNDTFFLQKLKIMDYSLLVGIHTVDKKNKKYHFHNNHRGIISNDEKEIYFAGIIDILQEYNAKKKVENVMRRITNNQKEISCAPPQVYANRMCDFLNQYIV